MYTTMFLNIKNSSIVILIAFIIASPIHAADIYESLSFNQLKGWDQAILTDTFNHYLRITQEIREHANKEFQKELESLDKTNNTTIKQFIETYYEPVMITNNDKDQLITGYHIFHAEAAYQKSNTYTVPIYQKPDKKKDQRQSHEAILEGMLSNKNLEIAWLKDSIDVYLLMMQGSGLLTFPDGKIKKVVYAGSNGYGYKSISQYMIDKKLIKKNQRNGPFIKQYLKKDLKRARRIIIQNPSYVFFKVDEKKIISGAAGSPLKPLQSLAIDKTYYPFHSLIWIETTIPKDQKLFRNLVIAQDTGGAIKGPQRGDLFFGIKKEAEHVAGLMKDKQARLIMLRLRSYD